MGVELVSLRGEINFNPRPQSMILVPLSKFPTSSSPSRDLGVLEFINTFLSISRKAEQLLCFRKPQLAYFGTQNDIFINLKNKALCNF